MAGAVHAAAVSACLWDRDTRLMERQRFPSVLEVVSGKFLRHSDAYYRWRVADRTARIARGEVGPELVDDLAVAHSKLGEDERAIALMEGLLEQDPRRYETLANLGTFHVHAGNLEVGAGFIQQALNINPEAHFGREVFQLLLVQYVLTKRADASEVRLPLCAAPASHLGAPPPPNFWAFLAARLEVDPAASEERTVAIGEAVIGLAGMIRFGNHASPILHEALSDLLLADFQQDAKGLAARALLRAADSCGDAEAAAAYREKARMALSLQTPESGESRGLTVEELEAQFAIELAEAEAWWSELRLNEAQWIASGLDVDASFAEVYYAEPTIGAGSRPWRRAPILYGLGAALIAAGLFLGRRQAAASGVLPPDEAA